MAAPPETPAPLPVSPARPPQACVACADPYPRSPHHRSVANSLLQSPTMYRVIDIVSIDVTSITGYHLDRATRGEILGPECGEAGSTGVVRSRPGRPAMVCRRGHFPEIE